MGKTSHMPAAPTLSSTSTAKRNFATVTYSRLEVQREWTGTRPISGSIIWTKCAIDYLADFRIIIESLAESRRWGCKIMPSAPNYEARATREARRADEVTVEPNDAVIERAAAVKKFDHVLAAQVKAECSRQTYDYH